MRHLFINPLAYAVFPTLYYHSLTSPIKAKYTGFLLATDTLGNQLRFEHTNVIDLTGLVGLFDIDLYTNEGAVKLGRWINDAVTSEEVVLTINDAVTSVPIEGATYTLSFTLTKNTYLNGQLLSTEDVTADVKSSILQANVDWITVNGLEYTVTENPIYDSRQALLAIQVTYEKGIYTASINIVLSGIDKDAIIDSMVLWYDIARQGCTNNNMAATPVLRDLSGNGHDATCYNFAWSGMSGIGGYGCQLYTFNDSKYYERSVELISDDTIKIIGETKGVNGIGSWNTGSEQFSVRLEVSGIKDGQEVYISQYNQDYDTHQLVNGINDLELDFTGNTNLTINYPYATYYTNRNVGDWDVTIKILPKYPNALVSDGVDDYAYVEGLPLFDKEKGYTVIAKREPLIDQDLGYNQLKALASKTRNWNKDGSFVVEYTNLDTWYAINFGQTTYIDIGSDKTIYQTSSSYNGLKNIGIGSFDDADCLVFFKPYNGSGKHTKSALYSFLLFDRDLTVNEINWVKENLIEYNNDEDWYGVEFYTTSSYPDCIRIGNPELHRTLPVHSQMKGCLLSDEGTVNKYLDTNDWTGEVRDGSQGQVMVEMPKDSYWKFETDGNIRRVKFSTNPLPGFTKTPQGYVSAYEASVQRSTNTLASVVNTTTDYRGGNNKADRDNTYRSQLGRPVTATSRTNFRNYARKRKEGSTEWNCMTYDMQKLLYWLFVVEYGTLHSQKTFDKSKDINGYAQGGLGNGVTNLNGTKWNNFNGYYPFISCGYTDSLGNGTGQVSYTMPFEYNASRSDAVVNSNNYTGAYNSETSYTDGQFVSQGEDLYECIAAAAAGTALTDTTYFEKVTRTVTYVPRYRGIENPFGHIWKWLDGINVRISPTEENGGDNLSKVFVCHDPSKFNDTNYDGYEYVGDEARLNGYIMSVIFGEGGEIMPDVIGGGSTTNFCDYHYTSIPTIETLRGVFFGGSANDGSRAGFVYAYSYYSPSRTSADLGSRLCFIPNETTN